MDYTNQNYMKRTAVISGLVLAGLTVTAFINPVSSGRSSGFEGVVTYTVVANGAAMSHAGQRERKITVYIKGNKSKTIVGSGNYINTIIANLNEPDDYILLMDADGHKYQLKNDPAKKYSAPVINYVDGTKTIEGYTCHKAEVTIKVDEATTIKEDVYYTTDISSGTSNREFRGLKGFPLEWVTTNLANTTTTTAINIDKKSLSDDEFSVPPGYKLVTQEEMLQDMKKK